MNLEDKPILRSALFLLAGVGLVDVIQIVIKLIRILFQ